MGKVSTLLESFKAYCTVRSKENNYSGGIIVYVKENVAKGCKRILPHLKDKFSIPRYIWTENELT